MYNLIFAISKTNDDDSGRAFSSLEVICHFHIYSHSHWFTSIIFFHSFRLFIFFCFLFFFSFSFYFSHFTNTPYCYANNIVIFIVTIEMNDGYVRVIIHNTQTLNAIWAVSFSGHGNNIVVGTRNEPISLSTLDRDCFIIPVHSLDRFLPAGIPVSHAYFIRFFFSLWLQNYHFSHFKFLF